jgi:putative FmdB family regulatory protein
VPTYQYTCTDCGEPVEAVQKFSDDPLTICPHCGGKLRKVFSPVGIVFKGSGFYRTDSRKGSAGDRPKKDKDKEPSGTGAKGSDSGSAGGSSAAGSPESSSSGSSDAAGSSSGGKKETKKSSTSAAAASSSS